MARPKPETFDKHKTVAENGRARFDYHIEDKFEAGLALQGTEVKALRAGEADICVASRFAHGASTAGWDEPERERLSGFANRIARAITGVELSDPMSGYFMLPTSTARALAPRLSGIE